MDIELRPVGVDDARSLAEILKRSNEVFRGSVPDAVLDYPLEESETNWLKRLRQGFDDRDFILLAVDQDNNEVVGHCWGCPADADSSYAGELKQIGIVPEYQRQGIGRLMLQTVAKKLAQQAMASMCVHVLAINPNRKFYEHLGARYVSQYMFDWDGFKTLSYIYGWDDTSHLIAASNKGIKK